MAGIGVNTPRGPGWEYSLDTVNWQSSRVFATLPDGSAFISGVAYPVHCRNLDQNAIALSTIIFGSPSNEETLDSVAQRSGRTTAVLRLLGGLFVGNLPTTTENYAALVVGPNGQVYLKGGSISLEPVREVIIVGQWEELPDGFRVSAPNSEWAGSVDNPVPTVAHPQPDMLITASGEQYYNINADLFADGADSQSLIARKYDKTSNAVSALPAGISFSFDAGTGLRRITVQGSFADQVLTIRITDLDSASQAIWDDHDLTVNRALARIIPDLTGLTHSNDFSFDFFDEDNHPSPGYAFTGSAGSWSWSSGQLCQTATSDSADQRMVQFTTNGSQNALNAAQTLALIKPTAFVSDSRLGIGLRYGTTGASDGYGIVMTDNATVKLLHNGVGFGPAMAFASVVNSGYYMRLKYEETGSDKAKISGKIWNALLAEPDGWPLVWENQPRKTGYPVLIGGYNGSKGCFGPWYDSQTPIAT